MDIDNFEPHQLRRHVSIDIENIRLQEGEFIQVSTDALLVEIKLHKDGDFTICLDHTEMSFEALLNKITTFKQLYG